MRRAVRFDNQDIVKTINSVDTTGSHAVCFLKNYNNQYNNHHNNYHNNHHNNKSITENGAIGFRTTSHPLLDLNFKVSSLRNRDEKYIVNQFIKAYYADWKHAVKWLFFLRDVLEGLGERRTFRICLKHLVVAKPQIALAVMKLVPEFGRWDDLLVFVDSPDSKVCREACEFIKEKLLQDVKAMEEKKSISLLAKWLPSNNTSSKEARRLAAVIAKNIGMSDRQYRKTLSALRAYGNVVEVQISASNWAGVAYEKVPAKANLKYDNAFARHDRKRRTEYLEAAFLGESKVNAKGLMPYEIVHRIVRGSYGVSLKENVLAELMWQKMTEEGSQNDWGLSDCIVVADGSGSMYANVTGSTSVRAIEVCNALAIYFAGQLKGAFHDKAVTFSGRPEFIDLAPGKSLRDKLEIMLAHNEVANTNIEAVFEMLLAMAVSSQVPAEEVPKQVLIISDMEFDMARRPDYGWNYRQNGEDSSWRTFDEGLFESIAAKYKAAGYTMPRLIFWNVCGRSDTIPMVEGESGICLLSGFSQNAMKTAAHREIKDPYESLLKTLDGERYNRVEEALLGIAG